MPSRQPAGRRRYETPTNVSFLGLKSEVRRPLFTGGWLWLWERLFL